MLRAMVDLETMGTGPRSAVLAVGAVLFSASGVAPSGHLYAVVDLESSMRAGLRADASTIKFWLGQPDDARQALLRDAEPLPVVLKRFFEWFRWSKAVELWGNGSDFDNVILRSAFDGCRLEAPWQFWQNRCFRTLKNTLRLTVTQDAEVEWRRGFPKHHALGDAYFQAEYASRLLRVAETTIVVNS